MRQKNKKALIVANGNNEREFLKKIAKDYSLIIAADGAGNILFETGIKPDVLVGDFDSVDPEVLDSYSREKVELLRLCPEKDYSDTHISIQSAMQRGYRTIDVVGAFGSRWDHSLGNLNLLFWGYKQGIQIRILSSQNEIVLCPQGEYVFEDKKDCYWSCLALFEDALLNIENMKYKVEDKYFLRGESIGLSNEFLVGNGKLTVKKGSVLVIQSLKD